MRQIALGFLCICFATCASAQDDDVQRNHITAGFGAAIPSGSTADYLNTAPLVSVSYGYRFTRFLQADIGFQVAFGAANNQNAEVTGFGTVQGGDHEYMLPIGARYIIPTPLKRMEFSAGGGAIYLHYAETAPSAGYYSSPCYTCSSRAGWGGYGLANASYFLDDNHNFHVGTTFEFVAGSTNGQAVGGIPGFQTTDHWSSIYVEVGVGF